MAQLAEVQLKDVTDSGVIGIDEKGRMRRFLGMREVGIFGAAAALFIFLSIARPTLFFTEANVFRVAQAISLLTIIGVGMTFLFIAGELDLSVGTMYGLLGFWVSHMMFVWSLDPALALPLGALAGAALGLANGLITTVFRVPSFIVTLGAMSIFKGALLISVKAPPLASREFKQEHAWYIQATSSRVFGHVPEGTLRMGDQIGVKGLRRLWRGLQWQQVDPQEASGTSIEPTYHSEGRKGE